MPLELIGAGFGRTGTMSVQAAIDILYEEEGKKCYHFGSIVTRPSHVTAWIDILSGKLDSSTFDWESLFGPERFAATLDHPCCEHYREMMEAYPDAKVILTRHPGGREKWYKSKLGAMNANDAMNRMPLKPIINLAMPILVRVFFPATANEKILPVKDLIKLVDLTEFNVWGERGIHDSEHALQHYDEWYSQVKEAVPNVKLLEYDVSMGWEPLCEFLGKPVPNVPFPREANHSTANIKRVVGLAETVAWGVYGLVAAGALGVALKAFGYIMGN